jgi:hypothetical protein
MISYNMRTLTQNALSTTKLQAIGWLLCSNIFGSAVQFPDNAKNLM